VKMTVCEYLNGHSLDGPHRGHHVEAVAGTDVTYAVIRLPEQLGLQPNEFEIGAVTRGSVDFVLADATCGALAPCSPASP